MCSAAPTTDISSSETTTVICAQRALDEVFPNVSNPINNNQVYFGSVDGTTRTYPGAVSLTQLATETFCLEILGCKKN
jgi:hypothetical protein